MKKKVLIAVFIFAVVIAVRFFCGVYEHDEYAEEYFFVKHRPTWKWRFYSPIGMSDTRMEELSKERQIEQQYFNEFLSR